MSSPEDKARKLKRLKNKKKRDFRVPSPIAKDLIVSGKFNQRIVKDKRGQKHDLEKMSFIDLVKEIQDE